MWVQVYVLRAPAALTAVRTGVFGRREVAVVERASATARAVLTPSRCRPCSPAAAALPHAVLKTHATSTAMRASCLLPAVGR